MQEQINIRLGSLPGVLYAFKGVPLSKRKRGQVLATPLV